MLEVKNISFGYSTGKSVLENISFCINPQEKVAIIGASSVGKTTLVYLISGLLETDKGDIFIEGKSIQVLKKAGKLFPLIQITFQNPDEQIISFTVERQIAFGLENLGIDKENMRKKVNRILKEFDIEKYRELSPNKLSGGEKQKLSIASAMIIQPKFLILDEPTAYLDPMDKNIMLNLIFNMNPKTSIIFVTSNLAEAILCDRIIILKDKKIIFNDVVDKIFHQDLSSFDIDIPSRFRLAENLKNNGIDVDFTSTKSTNEFVKNLQRLRKQINL